MPIARTPEQDEQLRSFSRWFDAECSRLGWSDREVARMAGVKTSTVNRWRHGVMGPTLDNAFRIAGVLGEAPGDILRRMGFDLDRDGNPVAIPPDLVPVPVLARIPADPATWHAVATERVYYQPDRAIRRVERLVAVVAPDDDVWLPFIMPRDLLIVDPRAGHAADRYIVQLWGDGEPSVARLARTNDTWWAVRREARLPLAEVTVLGVIVEIRRRRP